MSTHTPGPYKVEVVEREDYAPAWPQVCVQTEDWTIALCGRSTNPVAMANARLIAAAPELLAELREVVDWIQDSFNTDERPAEMIDRAQRLIHTAEGSLL